MARIRSIKPGFFTNDQLAEIDPLGRLLFAGLWCHADRLGRLEDRPRKIKAEVLPYDACDVDALLNDLAASGFIVRYEAAGVRYIQVATFSKHQTPNIKEVDSTIPPPTGTAPEPTPIIPAQYQHSADTLPALHLTGTVLEQDQEQVQDQSWGQEGVQGEPTAAPSPAKRKVAAKESVESFQPHPDDIAELERRYPDLDVADQTERWRDWCRANPAKARYGDFAAAWRNWMKRAVDMGQVRAIRPSARAPDSPYALNGNTPKTNATLAAIANFDPNRRHQ